MSVLVMIIIAQLQQHMPFVYFKKHCSSSAFSFLPQFPLFILPYIALCINIVHLCNEPYMCL